MMDQIKAFRLKICDTHTSTKSWCRMNIPVNMTFRQLHLAIQASFSWTNEAKYEFQLKEDLITITDDVIKILAQCSPNQCLYSGKVTLNEYLSKKKVFSYIYNMENQFFLEIVVEDELEAYNKQRCTCTGGENFDESGFFDLKRINLILRSICISSQELLDQKEKEILDENFMKELERCIIPGELTRDLKEILNRLTVVRLKEYARNLDIYGRSSMKKAELKEALFCNLLDRDLLESYFITIPQENLDELIPKLFSDFILPQKYPNKMFLYELYSISFLFSFRIEEEIRCILPDDIKKMFLSFFEKSTLNLRYLFQEVKKVASACVNLYGVVTFKEFKEIYKHYGFMSCSDEHMYDILFASMVDLDSEFYFIHNKLYNTVLNIYNANEDLSKEEVSYYLPEKSSFLRYIDPFWYEPDECHEEFIVYVKKHFNIDENITESLLRDIVFAFKLNDEVDAAFYWLDKYDLPIKNNKQFDEIVKLLIRIYNQSRKWSIKGWMPNELSALGSEEKNDKCNIISIKTGKKIGRNDLCPCGSGKKFKHCCME